MEECSRRLDRSRRSHVHQILFLFLAECRPLSRWTSVGICRWLQKPWKHSLKGILVQVQHPNHYTNKLVQHRVPKRFINIYRQCSCGKPTAGQTQRGLCDEICLLAVHSWSDSWFHSHSRPCNIAAADTNTCKTTRCQHLPWTFQYNTHSYIIRISNFNRKIVGKY